MSEWRLVRLKHLAAEPLRNGLGESGTFDDPTWPRYIRTTDIGGPRVLREDTFASLPPEIARQATLRRGDIVMTAAGATIGKSLLYNLDDPACYAGYLVRFRAKPDVDPRFVSYWTESKPYWIQIEAGKVVSTIENFSGSKYQNLVLRVPSAAEQSEIADFLDAETARIDAVIAKKTLLIDRVRERRAALTEAAVTGAFTSTDAQRAANPLPWAESIPASWRTAKLTLVAKLGSGHTPSRSHPEWWQECTIPWITTGEVAQLRDDRTEFITETREMVSALGVANSSAEVHPAGTVVLSRTASAGFSAIMGDDMATSQDFVAWTCGNLLEPRYLLLCLRAMRPDLLGRLAQGSTHKTIYMPDIESIRVPLPPIEEQRAIVAESWSRLGLIDQTVDRLRWQIALLTERRQALITAAVTGDLDIAGAA